MADIFREVDEDLRRDNLNQLWKKYGNFVVGAAVAVVLVVSAVVGWREWQRAENLEQSDRLLRAGEIAEADDPASAIAAYEDIAEDADGGHELLARLQAAALAAEVDDRERVAATYDAVAGSDVDPVYRDLATLLSVMHASEGGDPEALIERLGPLRAEDNPWRFSARELTAVLEHRRGNVEQAVELIRGLEAAPEAPPDLRNRAREMLAAMGAADDR